jgi:hypothetical protein
LPLFGPSMEVTANGLTVVAGGCHGSYRRSRHPSRQPRPTRGIVRDWSMKVIINTRANVYVTYIIPDSPTPGADPFQLTLSSVSLLPLHIHRTTSTSLLASTHRNHSSLGPPRKCLRRPLIAKCNQESKLPLWRGPPGRAQNLRMEVKKGGRGTTQLVWGRKTLTNLGHTSLR